MPFFIVYFLHLDFCSLVLSDNNIVRNECKIQKASSVKPSQNLCKVGCAVLLSLLLRHKMQAKCKHPVTLFRLPVPIQTAIIKQKKVLLVEMGVNQ